MEKREETSGQQQPTESALPKWKLKANWILRQYARIWRGDDFPYTINFDDAFEDVFIQFFIDEGLLEKDAKGCIKFAEFAWEEYRSHHKNDVGLDFFTSAEKWKWIIEKGMFSFLKTKFISEDIIIEVLYVADHIQKAEILPLKEDGGPWIDYEYCLSAPCMPPLGHEWVDDPWERLEK